MLNTGLNGSTCPDRGDHQLIQSQVSQAAASFLSSGGQEIPVVAGVGAVVDSLRGPFASPTPRSHRSWTTWPS